MSYLTSAGPFIWLILPFGLLGLFAAARYAARPSAPWGAIGLGASAAAVLLSLISLGLGYQRSAAAGLGLDGDARWIILRGLSESLNGVVVACFFALLACALLTLSALRGRAAASA